jgi:hypothetical protein
VPLDKVSTLSHYVYARAPGIEAREMGSVLLTAVVMSRVIGWNDPSELLFLELRRVLNIDANKFKRRWQEKIDAGVVAGV